MRLVRRSLLRRDTVLPSRHTCCARQWLLADLLSCMGNTTGCADPDRCRTVLDVLRMPLALWEPRHDGLLCTWACETHAPVHAERQFLLTLLLDQRRCIIDGYPEDFALDGGSLSSLFVPSIQLSLWTEARTPMSAVHKLISKSLPHKCQRREFPTLVRSIIDGRHGRWSAFRLLQLVACGLLGNNRIAQYRVRNVTIRRAVYCALHTAEARMSTASGPSAPIALTWMEELILAIPMMVIVIGREFVHTELCERSVLGYHSRAMFNLETFNQLAGLSMDRIRSAVDGYAGDVVTAAGLLQMCGPLIEATCEASQRAAPRVCYARFRPAFLWEAQRVSVRRPLPVPSRTQSQAVAAIVTRFDPTKSSDEDVSRELVSHLEDLGCGAASRATMEQLRTNYDDHRGGKRSLRSCMQRDVVINHGMALALLRLGAQFWRMHADGIIIPLSRETTLLQAEGLAHRMRVNGLSMDALVAEESQWLYVCPVCGAVYSCMRKASYVRHARPVFSTRRRQPRPPFSCGVISASVELMADVPTPYCANSGRDIGHMRCGDRPLVRINMLGNMVMFRRTLFFLCTDPTCGTLTTYLPGVCAYGQHGYLCIDCTTRDNAARVSAYLSLTLGVRMKLALPVSASVVRIHCAICNRRRVRSVLGSLEYLVWCVDTSLRMLPHTLVDYLVEFSCPQLFRMWLYHHGVVLCARHHTPHLLEAVRSTGLWMEPSRSRFVAALWRMHRTYVDAYTHHSQRHIKARRIH